MCCSVLQCVAVRFKYVKLDVRVVASALISFYVLKCVAVCGAVCCNMLQCAVQCVAMYCVVLQCVAACCSVLQCALDTSCHT